MVFERWKLRCLWIHTCNKKMQPFSVTRHCHYEIFVQWTIFRFCSDTEPANISPNFPVNRWRSSVFWTAAVGFRKSWHGKIMPNHNEINTVGSGQADELTKLDEIRQLDHQGQCCEYISVRFSDETLQPYIFAKKQEVTSHAEYFNIGKIFTFLCYRMKHTVWMLHTCKWS